MTEDTETTASHSLDLFLKFPDEATAQANLYTEEQPRFQSSVDIIGVIYKTIGDMDAEGNFLTAALPGWHVNLRGTFTEEQLAELDVFKVEPTNPVRVWA
jgi:hypothetical protein